MIDEPIWGTPRVRYILAGLAIATALSTVPVAFITMLGDFGGNVRLLLAWIASSLAFLGVPTLILGVPIAVLLRAVARRSLIANAIGVVPVITVTPALAVMGGSPFYQFWVAVLTYAVFNGVVLAIAMVFERRAYARAGPTAHQLTATFE